jgi:hypothetical protein
MADYITDQEILSIGRSLKDRGAPPEKIQEFIDAAKAEQDVYFSRREVDRRDFENATKPRERFAILIGGLSPFLRETLTTMGIRGGATAAGQMAGQQLGGPIGKRVGGSVVAALASFVDQVRKIKQGKQDKMNYGEIASDAYSAATGSRNPLFNAGHNIVSETGRSLIDEQKLPSMGSMSSAGAAGAAGTYAANKITGESLKPRDILFKYRNEVFADLRKDGIKVNPVELGRISPVVAALAGPAALSRDVSMSNAYVVQKLVRQDLGLPAVEKPFRPRRIDARGNVIPGEIDEEIKKAWKPYEDIQNISKQAAMEMEDLQKTGNHGPILKKVISGGGDISSVLDAASTLDSLKSMRDRLKDAYQNRNTEGGYAAWIDLKGKVAALEDKLDEAVLSVSGQKFKPELDAARKKLAIAYTVRDSTNGYGLTEPKALFDAKSNGVKLTGNLDRLADFHEAFDTETMRAAEAASSLGMALPVNYLSKQAANTNAAGLIPAVLPDVSSAIRGRLLSEASQNKLTLPVKVLNDANLASAFVESSVKTGGRKERPASLYDEFIGAKKAQADAAK